MIARSWVGVLAGVLAASGSGSALAQKGEFKDQRFVGHVYEPALVAASPERTKQLKVPNGFVVSRFAEGLDNPRMLAVADDGTVYVTQRKPGNLVMLRDTNGDGVADVRQVALKQEKLHGIAIRGTRMWLIDVKKIQVGDIAADGNIGHLQTLVSDLPDGGQHPNRTMAFGYDGMLYVSVGSTCNACDETSKESATILRVDPQNGKREIFASGLRNTIGFGWHPGSRRLYGMDHGIDWLGDDEHVEELNEIVSGAQYGWPYVYGRSRFNPQDTPKDKTQAEWAKMSREPVAGYTPHAAPMQMVFYDGAQFPAEYRGDAFVAFRGSWNRKPPSGHEIVRLRFDREGKFLRFEPFLTGFMSPTPNGRHERFGRPVGVAVMKDGSLLVSDDTNNVIYRVSYGTPRQRR